MKKTLRQWEWNATGDALIGKDIKSTDVDAKDIQQIKKDGHTWGLDVFSRVFLYVTYAENQSAHITQLNLAVDEQERFSKAYDKRMSKEKRGKKVG